MAGVVHVQWYATGFRGDQLEAQLVRISAIAPQYGATSYTVYRGREDRYKFLQVLEFDEHVDFDRYWYGPELIDFRTYCQGWFQVPVAYSWHDLVTVGTRPRRNGAPAEASAAAVE